MFLDAEGVVDEVVVHIHLAHTERLDARVFHVLLEIRMEAQDLAHGTQYTSVRMGPIERTTSTLKGCAYLAIHFYPSRCELRARGLHVAGRSLVL